MKHKSKARMARRKQCRHYVLDTDGKTWTTISWSEAVEYRAKGVTVVFSATVPT